MDDGMPMARQARWQGRSPQDRLADRLLLVNSRHTLHVKPIARRDWVPGAAS